MIKKIKFFLRTVTSVFFLLVTLTQVLGQGPSYLDTIDMFGERYDVFRVTDALGSGFTFNALPERQEVITPLGTSRFVTAVGDVINNAGGFSNGGPFLMIPNSQREPGEFSQAEDINNSGVSIGWRLVPGKAPRAFIHAKGSGLQHLDELYPAVRQLADMKAQPNAPIPVGTKGLRITDSGDMFIEGITTSDGNRSTRLYLVDTAGTVTPFFSSETDRVPDAHGRGPNKDGWFAEFPNLIHTSTGEVIDIGEVVRDQLADSEFISEWPANSGSQPLINDTRDVTWANLVFQPACSDPFIRFTASGLEFIDGALTGFVGSLVTVDYTLRNVGRGPLNNPTIVAEPATEVLRPIGGPFPPLPARLEPDQTFQTTVIWKVVQTGEYDGAFVLQGDDACGTAKGSVNTVLSQYVEPELGIKLPNTKLKPGDKDVTIIEVRLGVGEVSRTITFHDPLLKELVDVDDDAEVPGILTISEEELPFPFELTQAEPVRQFAVPFEVRKRGLARLSTAITSVNDKGETKGITATATLVVSPFEVVTKITPDPLRLNQTPIDQLGEKCREFLDEQPPAQEGEEAKFRNCIEIAMTVTNESDFTVENVNMPAALEIHSMIKSLDLEDPGVPLTPLRFYPPEGSFFNLLDPDSNRGPDGKLREVDRLTLEPGHSATFTWLLDAFDGNGEDDDSTELEFKGLVLGSIEGRNVEDLGKESFQVVEKPLLEWGVRPSFGITEYRSGQAVRVDGILENVSASKNEDEGVDLLVMLYQIHEGNVGGGYMEDVREVNEPGRPTYYNLFELPAQDDEATPDENERILNLNAIFTTLPTTILSKGMIRYGVRVWSRDENDQVQKVSSQAVLKDGWQEKFEVRLTINEEAYTYREYCENQLGISPFMCGFNEGGASLIDGTLGLLRYALSNPETMANMALPMASYDILIARQAWRFIENDANVKKLLIEDAYVLRENFRKARVVAPMALEAFALQAGEAMGTFFKALEEGDLETIENVAGKFLGENPDLLVEGITGSIVYRRIIRALNKVEADVVDKAVREAVEAAERRQAASLDARIAEKQANPSVTNLAEALEPGDKIPFDRLRQIYGVTKKQYRRIAKIARENNVTISFRARGQHAAFLLESGRAWPKPQAIKLKTVNEIDIDYLGYPAGSQSKVHIVEPPARLRGRTGKELEEAIKGYVREMKIPDSIQGKARTQLIDTIERRLKQRVNEWNDTVPELFPDLTKPDGPNNTNVEIDVNFGVADQASPRAVDQTPDIAADERRLVTADRVMADPGNPDIETGIDPVTGGELRTWEIMMDGPNGEFRSIVGDLDFMAILAPDGGELSLAKRRQVYAQLHEFLDMQHGDSNSYWLQNYRQIFLDCCVSGKEGTEAFVVIGPYGDQTPTAAKFVDNVSVLDAGMNAKHLPVRHKITEPVKVPFELKGTELVARRPDTTGEYVVIAGAQMNSMRDLKFSRRFFPDTFGDYLSAFLTLRLFIVPSLMNLNLAGEEANATFNRNEDAPILSAQSAPGEAPTFRVWEEGLGWRVIDEATAIDLGGPDVVDMAPMTITTLDAAAGTTTLSIMEQEELGATGAFFEPGDRIVINPGGENEEFAVVQALGSLILDQPLRFDHEVGEFVALAPLTSASDSDGDGFSDEQEIQLGTDPNNSGDFFRITSLTLSSPAGTTVNLSWPSLPGNRYIIEMSETLTAASWREMSTIEASSQETATSLEIPDKGIKTRYFRIRLQS